MLFSKDAEQLHCPCDYLQERGPMRSASRAGRAPPGSRDCSSSQVFNSLTCELRAQREQTWMLGVPFHSPAFTETSHIRDVARDGSSVLPAPEGGSRQGPGPRTHSTNASSHQCNSCAKALLLQPDSRN